MVDASTQMSQGLTGSKRSALIQKQLSHAASAQGSGLEDIFAKPLGGLPPGLWPKKLPPMPFYPQADLGGDLIPAIHKQPSVKSASSKPKSSSISKQPAEVAKPKSNSISKQPAEVAKPKSSSNGKQPAEIAKAGQPKLSQRDRDKLLRQLKPLEAQWNTQDDTIKHAGRFAPTPEGQAKRKTEIPALPGKIDEIRKQLGLQPKNYTRGPSKLELNDA